MAETESGDAAKRPVFRHLPPLVADLEWRDRWARARLVHSRGSRANRVRRSLAFVVVICLFLVPFGWLASRGLPLFRRSPSAYWWIALPMAAFICLASWTVLSGRARRWFGRSERTHVRDHRWKRPFDERGPWKRMLLAAAPFTWLVWQVPNLLLTSRIRQHPTISAVLALVLAAFVGWALYRLHGLFWTGTVRVRFEPFPMRPESMATITVGLAERATAPEALALRLVAYRERPHPYWKWPVEVFLQADSRVLMEDPSRMPASGSDVEIEFAVPRGPSTELSATYPTYWELELHVITRDGDYVESFLAPVYAADAEVTTDADATLEG